MTALDALRASLPPPGSPRFWRAVEELADDPRRRPLLTAAWPSLAELEPAMDRRGFLRLLGASLAFAGLAACSGPPPERIVAEDGRQGTRVPSSSRYATALATGGDVVGVIVQLGDGRPLKVDGNPRHPCSLGGSDSRLQAAILDLWDPARSSAPRLSRAPSSWADADSAFAAVRDRFANRASGLHIISPVIESPTLARQRTAFLDRYPDARWHVHEPAQGRTPDLVYRLADARVVVTLDADLLGTLPMHLRHAREFAAGRADPQTMSRWYAIEPTPSVTGRNADHAWPAEATDMPAIATALASRFGVDYAGRTAIDPAWTHRLDLVADDLRRHGRLALVVAGPYQAESVHAAVRAINAKLGNDALMGAATASPAHSEPMSELIRDMRDGRVDTLLCLESNPVFSCAGFAGALAHVPHTMHLGRYRDETANASQWHLPALHPFEAWSDLQAIDGSVSIVQPVLAPLVDGRSVHDVVDLLLGDVDTDALRRVRTTWPALASDDAWTNALRAGVFKPADRPGSGPTRDVAPKAETLFGSDPQSALDIVFRPDEWLWDGRHADNPWLQELPRPISSLTWGNAAWISPALAQRHGLTDGDVVRLEASGRHIEVPVLIVPGQAARTITLTLGHGRRTGIAEGIGHDVVAFRGEEEPWHLAGASLMKTDRREALASTQQHQDMGKRDVIRVGTPAAPPHYEPTAPLPSFYPDKPAGAYRWGMTIDLNACIGCSACTIACQAENNIPVVGKEEVIRGRRMHWIRVDRYHEGDAAAPSTYHQPVPCMHCEHAPCEVVCPVEATVHDSEGLNLQVYNRCIGTRFCSNNCPYKVRRFNFLQYADFASETLKAMRNPEVTVRPKGVMEKCTYCVQRIEKAHIAADRDQRRIVDGEITTACQDACPTRAIVFGDLGDPGSAVARASASPRLYVLLEELNTRPRTRYLAALRNPHPDEVAS